MRNKISLKYYKLNELILLLIGVTCSRIMQFIRYKEKYLPIKQEIQELLEFNLKLTRKDEILYINHYPGFHEYIFRLRLNTSDRFVFKQIIVDEEYRPIIDIIKEHQANESIRLIVDAGANIGLSSIFFYRHFPNAEVLSIEPDLSNYKQLVNNINTNNLNRNIKPMQKGLWDNNTDHLQITSSFRDKGYWSRQVTQYTKDDLTSVESLTLDDILRDYPDMKIDLLKIDVEGTEARLFNSDEFVECLKNSVRFLCIEIHNELISKGKVKDILIQNDFEVVDIGQTTFGFNNGH